MKLSQQTWIITALFALLLSGCKSKQRISEKQEITRIDTVTVVQEKIDTIFRDRVITKTKPVYFETEIPCDSLVSGRVGSGDSYTEYKVENGKIILKTKIDSVKSVYLIAFLLNYFSYYKISFNFFK